MYIVIEGIDGSGKTTLAKALQKVIPNSEFVFEPSKHSEINTQIREYVLQEKYCSQLNRFSRELLLLASRANSAQVLRSLITQGKTVISDRSFVSGMVYSLASSEIPRDIWLDTALSFECVVKPDILILVSPKEQRIDKNTGDIYDNAPEDFHTKIRTLFPYALGYCKERLKFPTLHYENDLNLDPIEKAENLKILITEKTGLKL